MFFFFFFSSSSVPEPLPQPPAGFFNCFSLPAWLAYLPGIVITSTPPWNCSGLFFKRASGECHMLRSTHPFGKPWLQKQLMGKISKDRAVLILIKMYVTPYSCWLNWVLKAKAAGARVQLNRQTVKSLLAAVRQMSGLDDSHISTAEMQKKIRSVAHEEGRPILICRTRHSVTLPFKLGLWWFIVSCKWCTRFWGCL